MINKGQLYRTVFKRPLSHPTTDFAEFVAISKDTEFPEYAYEGKKYCRIVANSDAVLSSGRKVTNGEVVWVKVPKVKWFVVPND